MRIPNTVTAVVLALTFSISQLPAAGNSEKMKQMRGYNETIRSLAWQGVIISTGEQCSEVTHSFIRGEDTDGTVYMTVRCRNGDDYMIMEGGDIGEGSRVLTCSEAQAIMRGMGITDNCWLPLSG